LPDTSSGRMTPTTSSPSARPAPEGAGAGRGLGGHFWAVWAAFTVSSLGDGAALVGFPLLAAAFTRSPVLIGAVAAAQRLPWLLVSLPMGAIVDRHNLRRLLVVGEVVRMLVVATLALAVAGHFHPLIAIYASAFLLGTFDTAFGAASSSMVPRLASKAQLGRANGWLTAGQLTGAETLGPGLGGLLASVALALPFAFDSATFAVSAVILVLALPRSHSAWQAANAQGADGRSVRDDALEGLRWFIHDPVVRLVALYLAALAFAQAAVFAVFVLWALRVLHLSRAGYGLLLTVSSVGTGLAAAASGRWADGFNPARLLVWAGTLAGVSYLALALNTNRAITALALLVENAAVGWGNVTSYALRQRLIPRELLGRVSNAMRACIYGAVPLGALAGGGLAAMSSLKVTFLAAGALQLILVAMLGTALVSRLSGASPRRSSEGS
jgi:MFS family permease